MRFYKQHTPEVGDLVVVKIKRIEEVGVYGELLEYNGIEGFIQLSELSKGNVSLKRFKMPTKEGKIEICEVLMIDQRKGNIDLSKRRVHKNDFQKIQQKYNESKKVHSIMQHISIKLDESFEELLDSIVWRLNEDARFDFHSFNAFILGTQIPEEVFQNISFKNEKIKKLLFDEIDKRFSPPLMKFKSEIELTCFGESGIDGIKSALKAGKSIETKEHFINIQLLSSPVYILTTMSKDYKYGISLLESCIDEIRYEIKNQHGKIRIKENPRIYKDEEFMKRVSEIKENNQQIDDLNEDFIQLGDDEFICKYSNNNMNKYVTF